MRTRNPVLSFLQSLFCCTALFTFSTTISVEFSFQEVANLYLPSFGISNITRTNTIAREIHKRYIVTRMFSTQEGPEVVHPHDTKPIFTRFLQDMNILCGDPGQESHHLFSKINRTQTLFGEMVLAKNIINPITDTELLEKRIACIEEIANNETLYEELTNLLTTVQKIQDDLIHLWEYEKSILTPVREYYIRFRPLKKWNKSALALELYNRFTLALASIKFLTQESIFLTFNQYLGCEKNTSVLKLFLEKFSVLYNPFDPRTFLNPNDKWSEKSMTKKQFAWKSFCVLQIVLSKFKESEYLIKSFKDWNKTTTKLKRSLISARTTINVAESLNNIIEQNSVLKTIFRQKQNSLALKIDTKKIRKLKKLLAKKTFANEDTNFYASVGTVLRAYHDLNDTRSELLQPLYTLGQLDAYLSCARLYRECQNNSVRYCFAEYVKQDSPYVSIENVWNPFVATHKAVPNTLSLGQPLTTRNVILTGSVTGGKSTFMKALGISALLAQTIGMAPAQNMKFTPYTLLGTSLNIKDDVVNEISSFRAEILRAKELLQHAYKLKPNEFALLIIDEPFKGTNPTSAPAAARILAKRLNKSPQTMYLLSTHFIKELSPLEAETNGLCKNYNVDVNIKRTPFGVEFIRPFKLAVGPSQHDISLEMLHQEINSINHL